MLKEVLENGLSAVYRDLIGRLPSEREIERDLPKLSSLLRRVGNRPANFLKHADRDPGAFLDETGLSTDHLLLEGCTLYLELGLESSAEISAFGRWHLAVYPSEDSDSLETAVGPVHLQSRDVQLEVGNILLNACREAATSER